MAAVARKHGALLAILLLGAFLRVYQLGTESLWLDEGFSVWFANQAGPLDVIQRSTLENGPPTYYLFLHYWVALFGDSEFSVRLPSALSGILAIFVIYAVGTSLFGRNAGLLAALIMAVSPFQIMYSQEARVYGLMVLLALVSFYFFVRVLSKERSTPAQVGYVISTSALMYTHVYALFVVLAQNVYLAGAFLGKALGLKTEARPGLERWLFLQACLFVLYVPALFRILGLVQTPVNRWWIKPPSLGSVYRVLVHYSGSPLLLMLLAAFALLAAVALAKSDPGKLCLLLSWLLVPVALPIVISILYQPVFVDRYGITALPAFYLLAAKGVEVASGVVSGALPRRTARAPGGTAVCLAAAALLLMLCAGPLWRYFHEVDKDQWREVAHYVDAHAQAGDLVLLDPPRLQLPFVYNYYSKRKDLVELSAYLPGGGPLLANEAKKHDKVWLVHAHRPRGPLALQQSLFAESHVPVYHRRYKGIDLTLLEKR